MKKTAKKPQVKMPKIDYQVIDPTLWGNLVIPRQDPALCRIVVNITSIRIYLYGQLFVMIRRELFAGFSSWISGGDKYCAAFYLKQGQPIEVELDSREKFDALLAEVDKVLGKE